MQKRLCLQTFYPIPLSKSSFHLFIFSHKKCVPTLFLRKYNFHKLIYNL